MKRKNDDNISEVIRLSVKAILEKKGEDTILMKLGKLTSFTDDFLICSADTTRQVSAIAEHVESSLKKNGIKPLGIEGNDVSHWIIVDYGDLIVHVFKTEVRKHYLLEECWSKADIFKVEELTTVNGEVSFKLVSESCELSLNE